MDHNQDPNINKYTDTALAGTETVYRHRDVKQAVGQSIAGVDGVLGLKGRLADIFKKDEDLTRGITVHTVDEGHVNVRARVIAEAGYNSADLLRHLVDGISKALWDRLGLVADKVDVQIAETLTRAGFYEKYDPQRAIH